MITEIYEGFRYQLTKYQNYLVSKLLTLRELLDNEENTINEFMSQFQLFYENNKLHLDPEQYVNYNVIITYTPPEKVYTFIELLEIPEMLRDSFIREFKFCYFSLKTDRLSEYHPMVRMEIIKDLYDAIYLDLYNTYLRYLNYVNSGNTNYSFVYGEKLKDLIKHHNDIIYPQIISEIGKIEHILKDLFEYRRMIEKDQFNITFTYYNTMNIIYENEYSLNKVVDYHLLIDEEKFCRVSDKYDKTRVKVLSLYINNKNIFDGKMNEFNKISKNFEIVKSMVKTKLNI